MKAIQTGLSGHYCPECDRWYAGELLHKKTLCCDHEAGTDLEDVCYDEQWGCADRAGPCWLDEGSFEFASDLWECGECGSLTPDVAGAINCCM